MNSPWAMISWKNCETNKEYLVVGNFGSGEILVYHLHSGELITAFQAADDVILTIDGLWGLLKICNKIYFAAGINRENNGLFGYLKLE